MNNETTTVTAAAILIGNELLSGSVVDENMNFIANNLVDNGINLVEVRVIPDDKEKIIGTVRELKSQVDYVFTTGGIGPTHDDITSECIALAFDKPLIQDPVTAKILREFFKTRGVDANDERMRMANMPEGAQPVEHEHGPVPGFRMDNVYVMAGVPRAMQAMLLAAIPELRKGDKVISKSVTCDLQEGVIAKPLGEIQARYNDIDIGSYPLSKEHNYNISLVVRGQNQDSVSNAFDEIKDLISQLNGISI